MSTLTSKSTSPAQACALAPLCWRCGCVRARTYVCRVALPVRSPVILPVHVCLVPSWYTNQVIYFKVTTTGGRYHAVKVIPDFDNGGANAWADMGTLEGGTHLMGVRACACVYLCSGEAACFQPQAWSSVDHMRARGCND